MITLALGKRKKVDELEDNTRIPLFLFLIGVVCASTVILTCDLFLIEFSLFSDCIYYFFYTISLLSSVLFFHFLISLIC